MYECTAAPASPNSRCLGTRPRLKLGASVFAAKKLVPFPGIRATWMDLPPSSRVAVGDKHDERGTRSCYNGPIFALV